MNPITRISVRAYHERSKHHLDRYAAGPMNLDWRAQPKLFRRFTGCELQPLRLSGDVDKADRLSADYADLYHPGLVPAQALNGDTLSDFFALSLGLSAWKQYGTDRWSLRCNPSSGNLHPTEAYALIAGITNADEHHSELAGLYHYASHEHALECRNRFNTAQCAEIKTRLPADAFLVGLSSIHWREAWKYGERAFRYCQHDVGHALGCLRYAGAVLGWSVQLLDECTDAHIGSLLGLDRKTDFSDAENEYAELLLVIQTRPNPALIRLDTQAIIDLIAQTPWQGQANRLDPNPQYRWPLVDDIASATLKKASAQPTGYRANALPPLQSSSDKKATAVIIQRRSAQAFDGHTSISRTDFYTLLDTLLPRPAVAPLDVLPWEPRIHLLLFVHRVEDLPPGLYALPRNTLMDTRMREVFREQFDWQIPEDCPTHLPLYRLIPADSRQVAKTIACHQDIAADSAFSLGMLAQFDQRIDTQPWYYRQLFWECGLVGQALYLEAEAIGLRGTGIGCFFDDAVHELLGLKEPILQSLYHFTIGGALNDARIASLPPYAHLQR